MGGVEASEELSSTSSSTIVRVEIQPQAVRGVPSEDEADDDAAPPAAVSSTEERKLVFIRPLDVRAPSGQPLPHSSDPKKPWRHCIGSSSHVALWSVAGLVMAVTKGNVTVEDEAEDDEDDGEEALTKPPLPRLRRCTSIPPRI